MLNFEHKNKKQNKKHFCKDPTGDSWVISFCIVRSFEKEDFLENSHPVWFCLIEKHSF